MASSLGRVVSRAANGVQCSGPDEHNLELGIMRHALDSTTGSQDAFDATHMQCKSIGVAFDQLSLRVRYRSHLVTGTNLPSSHVHDGPKRCVAKSLGRVRKSGVQSFDSLVFVLGRKRRLWLPTKIGEMGCREAKDHMHRSRIVDGNMGKEPADAAKDGPGYDLIHQARHDPCDCSVCYSTPVRAWCR